MMPQIPEQDINKVRQVINTLRGLDLSKPSIDEIKILLQTAICGHKARLAKIRTGTYFYRAVRYSDKPIETKFLSYPPTDKAKMGRANRDGDSVFYSASEVLGALREIYPTTGEKVVISKWKSVNEFQCQIMYDFFDYFNIESVIELNEYIRECFRQNNQTSKMFSYKITVAIAELLLAGELISGLIYPPANNLSFNMNNVRFDNYVFKPAVVNNHLELVEVNYIVISESSNNEFKFYILDYGIPNETKIIWQGINKTISDTFIKQV